MPKNKTSEQNVPSMPRFMSRFDESLDTRKNPEQYQSDVYWAPNNMLMTPAAVRAQSAPPPELRIGESAPVTAYPYHASMWNQYISQLPEQGPESKQNMPYALMDVNPQEASLQYGYQIPQRKQYVPGPGFMYPEDAQFLQSAYEASPEEYKLLRLSYPRR